MKELSTEQKVKRYDEALERAKECHTDGLSLHQPVKDVIEYIFPELKKSEDEIVIAALKSGINGLLKKEYHLKGIGGISFDRINAWLEKQGETFTKKDVDDAYLKGVTNTKNEIEKQYEETYQIRKDIATFIFNYKGDIKDRAKWINYLGIKVSFVEKQGEQKSTIEIKSAEESLGIDSETYNKIVDECIYGENKPTDKVEPKFKVGDWVFIEEIKGYKQGAFQIKSIDEFGYNFDEYHIIPLKYEELLSKWTIQDAKDGDVLINWNNTIFIFKDIEDESVKFHIAYNEKWDAIKTPSTKSSHMGLPEPQFEFHPATKEQRDLLFQKMKEAGLGWDAENKEKLNIRG